MGMLVKRLIYVAAAYAAVNVAAPASAAIMTATFAGVINTGVDNIGLFGTPGDLAGKSVTAVYTYDTAGQSAASSVQHSFSPDALIRASVRINEINYDLQVWPENYGFYIRNEYYASDSISILSYFLGSAPIDSSGQLNTLHFDIMQHGIIPAYVGLDGLYSFAPPPCPDCGFTTGGFSILGLDGSATSGGRIDLTSVEISEVAVPEPGTWMMLILGFGFIGATMRRSSCDLLPGRRQRLTQ